MEEEEEALDRVMVVAKEAVAVVMVAVVTVITMEAIEEVMEEAVVEVDAKEAEVIAVAVSDDEIMITMEAAAEAAAAVDDVIMINSFIYSYRFLFELYCNKQNPSFLLSFLFYFFTLFE